MTNEEKMQSLKKEIEKVKENPLFCMISKETIIEVILEIVEKYINEEVEH